MSVLRLPTGAVCTLAAILLAGCATQMSVAPEAAPPPAGAPLPASIPAQDLAARRGFGAPAVRAAAS